MDRLSGFAETLARKGCRLDTTRIFQGDFSFKSGMDAVEHVLRVNGGVTAIWAQNDLMAAGLQSGIVRAGVKVPEEMSIIGMDDLLIPEIAIPSLTTVAQPVKEMAEKAVDMILKTKDKIGIRRKVLLHPRLVVRESTARNKSG
jgi:DNA-binding LacI/PurR family transcriptional regulator